MKILKRAAFEHRQMESGTTGEKFSRSAVLSTLLESRDFFIHHEIIPPGRRSSSPHFHRRTDEFVYILRGLVVAVEGEAEAEMTVGDCAVFPAGSGALHFLENRSRSEAEVLIVSKRLAQSDVEYRLV